MGVAHADPDTSSDEEPTSDEDDSSSGDSPASDSSSEEDPLSRHRTDFDVLMDRSIGKASQPVAFNWRRTDVHIAATGSFLFELNNFNSGRSGAMARFPMRGSLFEVSASYVFVGDTPSSRLLALTPYRQPGRPARIELDATVAIPLAEGVVTSAPRFLPAAQLVFNVYAGMRYSIYPTGWSGLRPRAVVTAILSPRLSDDEIDNLDGVRRTSMQVDRGRYNVMVGFGNDIYFKQGLFISPRFMFAVPLLAPASETDLLFWADASLAIGVAL
ncbi:MAG: hypothetical protein ACI9MC_001140 [Kiritimatiellia bacterium]|jgi:hypothetical protein